MIRPKNNRFISYIFHHYIKWIIQRNFHNFNFNQVDNNPDQSILLLANHFSWWDGFILYWLNYRLFKKKFHIMIMEDTVRRVFFLKYMGAFSITKHSRQMLESLDYAAHLLRNPNNLVLIFPQGKLYSNFSDQIIFEKGLMNVVKKAGSNFQYTFAAIFIEYFQHKKPFINVYIKKETNRFSNIEELQKAYQQHYNLAKQHQTEIVI